MLWASVRPRNEISFRDILCYLFSRWCHPTQVLLSEANRHLLDVNSINDVVATLSSDSRIVGSEFYGEAILIFFIGSVLDQADLLWLYSRIMLYVSR